MLNWGIIGCGHIACVFNRAMAFSKTSRIMAVASKSKGKAAKFADTFNIPKHYNSYEEMLADDDIDVVYIATLHPDHAQWAIKSARAGKHILVEKPIALNYAEAAAIVDAADANDVFLMEAFMYRCHPQTAKLVELVKQGAIGKLLRLRAVFSYSTPEDNSSRAYSKELGGGAILDVGCYPASMVRLLAGASVGNDFADPVEIKVVGRLAQTGVDIASTAVVKFESGITAELVTGLDCQMADCVSLWGTQGRIVVDNPWLPSSPCRVADELLPDDTVFPPGKIILSKNNSDQKEEILVEVDRDLFTYEIDTVAANIDSRQCQLVSWKDSLSNMRLLDDWRKELGVVYRQDLEFHSPGLISLSRDKSESIPMEYGTIEGLDKKVSRLVHGVDRNLTIPYTEVMFDRFFELGGNCFDTSHGYAGGLCERNLGKWIRSRGLRDKVVVIEKGGNPPNGTPEGIAMELREGLDRLGMNKVDAFLIHRDSPEIPVGELVDILNDLRSEGLMTIFGVSNWSMPRLIEAKEYAEKNGCGFFSIVSNQFSLARILNAWWYQDYKLEWASCSEPKFRKWFTKTQTTLIPWSSQSSGFFADEWQQNELAIERCWSSTENLERKNRAQQLAAKYNVSTMNIALAWVLGQNFPVFPLIGPRQPMETRDCMKALKIKLSPEEMRWLDLESGDA